MAFVIAPKAGTAVRPLSRTVSIDTLHRAECKACPLNNQAGLKHPHMAPTGSKKPLVYVLGEAPGADEDRVGEQFVGRAGQVLRSRIPDHWNKHLRWNNVVRTRPPKNRTPEYVEIECCRPSIIRDIEATKPKAIFGFGNVPLHWAIKQGGITNWRGRRIPVKIGNHSCWFFPMYHPSYVQRKRSDGERDAPDIEFVFELDLKRAFDMIEDLPDPIVHDKQMAYADVEFVTGKAGDADRVIAFMDSLDDEKVIGIDFETKRLRPYDDDARILTVAVAGSHSTLAWPLRHQAAQWSPSDLKRVERRLIGLLRSTGPRKAVHNLAFELEWAAHGYGKDIVRCGKWEDSVSQAFILDERMGGHSLEFLGIQYFGINLKDLTSLDRNKLDAAPLDEVLLYNGVDAKYHRLLYLEQAKQLKATRLMATYRDHLRRIPTMVLTQLKGLPISTDENEAFFQKYTKRQQRVEAKIAADPIAAKFKRRFGKPLRPSANNDIKNAVRKIIGKPIDKADEPTLKTVRHKFTNLILRYRSIAKILSTYILPVREGSACLFADGKIHPVISTVRTRTQRTASDSPNIQNWPKRDGEQKEVRRQIKPRSGRLGARKIVSFDYGQIQARNVAMESKDKALVEAFWKDYDIHWAWTERIAQLYPQWCEEGVKKLAHDKDYRKKKRNETKNELVFPSLFGASAKSVSGYLEIPIEIAQRLHDEFWHQFPDVKAWHTRLYKLYKREGYVTGLTGFRRRAPISPNQLINSPIQSDEAAIVCDAMTRLSEQGCQAVLEIHDDLSFIWYEHEIEKQAEFVIGQMLDCSYDWAKIVPIVVEMAVGDDWYNLEDVAAFNSKDWQGNFRQALKSAGKPMHETWGNQTGWSDRLEKGREKEAR